jgi:hypothetical protein
MHDTIHSTLRFISRKVAPEMIIMLEIHVVHFQSYDTFTF